MFQPYGGQLIKQNECLWLNVKSAMFQPYRDELKKQRYGHGIGDYYDVR